MSDIGNKSVFAKNLRYFLERGDMQQKELAELVDVSTSTVSDWINGRKYPRIDKIEMIANHFGILKSDLIEDKKDDKTKDNDAIASIIVRLRMDEDFLSLVYSLYEMDSNKITGVKQMLDAFNK